MKDLSDLEKLHLTVSELAKINERTLIAPLHMKSSIEAKAYNVGANDAFKQIAEMANFCLDSLSDKPYEKDLRDDPS